MARYFAEADLLHDDGLADLYRDLHAHPELSFQEERNAAIIADRLRARHARHLSAGRGGDLGWRPDHLAGTLLLVFQPAEEIDRGGVTVGAPRAGMTENIIPAEAELPRSIRTFDEHARSRVLAGTERIVHAEAAASGAKREPMVVIFAGYEDRMEQFFGSNPGLSSRVARWRSASTSSSGWPVEPALHLRRVDLVHEH